MRTAFLALTLAVAIPARAELDKESCISAYDQGQRAKLHGELLHARELLAVCAQESCGALSSECVQWLDEVNRTMPSIVLAVKGRDGGDLTNVRVYADGRLLTEKLDGKAIELDPGEHELRFDVPGENVPEQHVLLMEGQKARPVLSAAEVPKEAPPIITRPMPVAAWVVGGLTLAAFTTFGVFASTGVSDYAKLPPCKCGPGEGWDKAELAIADVSLAVAVTGLVVAAVIFFTRPTKVTSRALQTGTIRF